MKLLKPEWVHHDDKPIFSVDIHPDGERFATGGQGNDSGRVVVWNLLPVLSEKAELDKTISKLLCQMDNHLACVNCVRWSLNGHMLASGGDDKLIMIWKRSKGSSGVFGSSGLTKNVENWRCVYTLRGHAGDVLDMAWSPQDRWLASCSVDNTIIIWDVPTFPSIVAILKGHTGLVKGVTWDPVGKFLASQSDDRSVKIWRTSDWLCQSTITEPFDECGGTTHILRLSWSPDGQYLVSAHAMNGGGPTAQIIEREGWKCDKDFVGHRKAVTCVRFNNSILKRQTPNSNKSQQYCCLAIGSRDRSLSVWMTALQRPSVVIHKLFEDSILDLSWSTDGYILLSCSGDGTVACLQFTPNELGTPLSEEDKNILYQRMYGKSATVDLNLENDKDMIIENSILLNNTEKSKPPILINTNLPELLNNNSNNKNNYNNDNIDSNSVNNISNNRNNKLDTKIIDNTIIQKPIHKQIETRTADGKRRITPMFIPINEEDCGQISTEFSSSSRNTSNIVVEKIETTKSQQAIMESRINIDKDQEIIINGEHSDNNRKIDHNKKQLDARLTRIALTPPLKTTTINEDNDLDKSLPTVQTVVPVNQQKQVNKNLIAGKAQAIQNACVKTFGEYKVQIQNSNITTSYGAISKVFCYNTIDNNKKYWEIFTGSQIGSFCCCKKYVLICCLDGSVRFINISTGIAVLPTLSLPTSAVQCAFSVNGQLGGVLTECGIMRVWNITKELVYITTTCQDILRSGVTACGLYITDKGIPFILLTNGTSYTFSKNLESWLVLNSRDPIIKHGLAMNTIANFQKNMKQYPLMSMQTQLNVFQPQSSNVIDISANLSSWQHTVNITFIENQLKLCEIIESPDELKYWYSMLAHHLANNGNETRIRLLLDDLLGSIYGKLNANETILGINKHDIMVTVLEHFKYQPQWQRIYMEYNEQLNDYLNKNKVLDQMDLS